MYSVRTPPASRKVAWPIETMSSSVSSAWFTRWPLTKVPLWLPRSKIWYRPVGDIFSSACALETPRSCTTMSLSGRRPIFTTRADCSLMREVGSRSTPGSDACGSALPQPANGDTPAAAGDDPREAGGAADAGAAEAGGAAEACDDPAEAGGAVGRASGTGSSSNRSTGPSSGLPTWITHGPSMLSREIRSEPA